MLESKRVSVVMPAYNEEKSIADLIARVNDLGLVDEIIVVDDGSKDNTAAVAGAQPNVRVVRHPYNIGNGAAVKSGIRAAEGDLIILMDSDGQHPPEEIPEMVQYIDQYDMVVGARTAASQAKWHRTIANQVFNTYASYVVGRRVPDLTSGFRILNARIAKNFVYLLPNAYSYPTTLTISFFRAGYAVKYHPFVSPAREKGTSSGIKPLKDGLRFMMTITRMGVLFVPLKIFLPVSMALFLSGGGYVIYRLLSASRFSGFGGMILTIGIVVFMLGLVAEQVALLRLANSEG